jgi:hypothetical protein
MVLALTCSPAADLERLGVEIAELSAHLDAATAHLLALLRDFDARKGWSGFHSCAHWLSYRASLDLGAAREKVRVARALGTLPALAGALTRGELSYAKVRALTRVATPATEARLLAVGRAGTAAQVERIVRAWRWVDRKEEARVTGRRHKARGLTVTHDDDGMVVVRGRLEPEVGALLLRALEAARETLYQRTRPAPPDPRDPAAQPPTAPQRQADAPVLADPVAPGQALVEGGAHVSAETSQRLACDAGVVVMRHGPEGQTLDVGRRTRTIPPAIRRALLQRDTTCRFPGCHVPFGQGHHLRHWGIRWSASQMETCASAGRMGGRCRRRLRRLPCRRIPWARSGRGIGRRSSRSTRARRAPSGAASASTWAMQSTSCGRPKTRRLAETTPELAGQLAEPGPTHTYSSPLSFLSG